MSGTSIIAEFSMSLSHPQWLRLSLVLLIHRLLLLPLFVGILWFVFVLLFTTLCTSGFAIILMEKRDLVALQ